MATKTPQPPYFSIKPESIIHIAQAATRRLLPNRHDSIAQLEKSTNPEIRLGVEAIKRELARYEQNIAEAIIHALTLQKRETSIRIAELENALKMLTTWAKTPADEEGGDQTYLVEVVIEHARKVLGLDEQFELLDNVGCHPDCGHSEAEHLAFDEGLATGRARGIDVECPYQDPLLHEAWATGHSVGCQDHKSH